MTSRSEAARPGPGGAGPGGADDASPDGELAGLIAELLPTVPDFPAPGIGFRDISPLLSDAEVFARTARALARFGAHGVDLVAGIEARGFFFAAAAAQIVGGGVLGVRKAGKLPPPVHRRRYALEYGEAQIEIPARDLRGRRVLVVDDVLATGGTARAAAELIEEAGAQVAGIAVVLEIAALRGRKGLARWPVHSLLRE